MVQQKKKCDEAYPKCARCQQYSQECQYDAHRVRQPRGRIISIDHGSHATETSGTVACRAVLKPSIHRPRLVSSLLRRPTKRCDESQGTGRKAGEASSKINDPDFPSMCSGKQQMALLNSSPRFLCKSSVDLAASQGAPWPCLGFLAPAYFEFSEEDTRRYLMDHFCRVLSPLIVLWEDKGNPFLQLILPLTHGSQAVTAAIYAFASAHLEVRGISSHTKSPYFYHQAIAGLIELTEQDDLNKNELLAASILLVYYEVVRAPFITLLL